MIFKLVILLGVCPLFLLSGCTEGETSDMTGDVGSEAIRPVDDEQPDVAAPTATTETDSQSTGDDQSEGAQLQDSQRASFSPPANSSDETAQATGSDLPSNGNANTNGEENVVEEKPANQFPPDAQTDDESSDSNG